MRPGPGGSSSLVAAPRQPVPVAVKQRVRRSWCRKSGCTTSQCRWMGSGPARGKAWTPRTGPREPASAGCPRVGAEIMGRRKFGPHTGPWPDPEWNGWWGDNPPFHTPVFVLTHHPRPSVQMNGGTTFHFLAASPAQALAQARQAAAGGDIRIGGGPSIIREFLAAGLIDYLHIVVVPIVLGRGERLWDGREALAEHFQPEAVNSPSGVTHLTLSRR